VDDVISGQAHDPVATAAAEQDVGGIGRFHGNDLGGAVIADLDGARTMRYDLIETGNQRDVLFQQRVGIGFKDRVRARDGGGASELGARVHILDAAGQHVVKFPA